MNRSTTLLHIVGRASVAAGTAVALAVAIAVAHGAPALRANAFAAPAEVVRLDPVVVTVSASRFEAIRAETAMPMIGRASVPATPRAKTAG